MPLADSPLARRTSLLRPTAVNAILAEMRQVQSAGRDVISLMRGEPDFPTPQHIVDAATAALTAGRTHYPDNRGEPRLRHAVAAKLRRDNGVEYDPNTEILITTGATLGIHAAVMALLDDGDEVLVPDPIYDAYASPVMLGGGRIRPVRARVEDGRFTIDAGALDAAAGPSTRVLLLNTPWNPTGAVLRDAELRALLDVVVRRDLVLVSDEIYEALTYDGARHVSPAALESEYRARTVIVHSLSKTYAMTGWRVGYCAAPPQLIDAMFLALQQVSRGPATFVQDAAAIALEGAQDAVGQMRQEYARRRALVVDALAGIPGTVILPPEGGFFAMADISALGLPSDDVRRRLLREFGVAVMHGAAYGEGGEGFLRISFGRGGDLLAQGLERVRAGLLSIRR